jgi:uncharacterized protein YndB with AHSA1/START domain
MSIKVEANGRRSMELAFEVEATPEQVWQAIATGEGVSSWLMPAELEMRDGKPSALKMSFGPGMETSSRITAYEEPRYFALEADSMMPGSPPIAAEWHIESKGGGVCKVRIVQSLFASTDEWDGQIEALEGGWSAFLETLKIYLRNFAGQRSSLHKFMTPTDGTEAQVWDKLTTALSLKGAGKGQQWSSNHGAPALTGVVEYLNQEPYDALIRLSGPGAGIAAFGTVNMGGPTMIGMNLYTYGDGSAQTGEREMAKWQAWLQETFPAPAE